MVGANGQNGTRKNTSLILSEIAEQVPEEMTYQAKLRGAVFDGVTEADVAEIVKGITARAKEGDAKAIDQFFDFVVGAKSGPKQVTVNQHIHCDGVEQAANVARQMKGKRRLGA